MNNTEIRKKILQLGLKYWQIADAMGISSYTLSVWLRHELTGSRLERVRSAIEDLQKGGADHD